MAYHYYIYAKIYDGNDIMDTAINYYKNSISILKELNNPKYDLEIA